MTAKRPLVVVDVTRFGAIQMSLLEGHALVCVRRMAYTHGSSFLAHVLHYVKLQKLQEKNVKGIALVEGRGSFSAVRAAVSVLNTLQWTKGMAVAGFDCRAYADEEALYSAIAKHQWQRARTPLHPLYQGEPHITKPKKKQVMV